MQGIYTYIPETNYVPWEYSAAAILLLLFMVLISLVSVLNVLYFYVSTFRNMCAVPNMAVFCSSLTSCFPGMLLTYFLKDFEIVPVAPIITGITFVFTFHIRWIIIIIIFKSSVMLRWLVIIYWRCEGSQCLLLPYQVFQEHFRTAWRSRKRSYNPPETSQIIYRTKHRYTPEHGRENPKISTWICPRSIGTRDGDKTKNFSRAGHPWKFYRTV